MSNIDSRHSSPVFKELSADKNPYVTKMRPIKENSSSAAAKKEQLYADKEAYLNLLITQLKNQNPQSPTDTSQMTQMIVSISQAEQVIEANQKMEKILELQLQSHRMNATSLIGKEIEYDTAEQNLEGGKQTTFQFKLGRDAEMVKVKIYDDREHLVRTVHAEKESLTEGYHDFKWDGRNDKGELMSDDNYKIQVEAVDEKGAPIEVYTNAKSKIIGILEEMGSIKLLLENGKSIDESQAKIYMERSNFEKEVTSQEKALQQLKPSMQNINLGLGEEAKINIEELLN
ncbi:flagellar hook assembly protein FlgD [Rickettsiales endosymbiont of Stachyamoeba lipophora]|uniref:flagellar hook assembly protein FlgD n=1 Tax=Rickettsiales endosymbiont of Stachyamoeba lipophora TaxID=2486578 RepID=UPI000F64C3B0|nr:flagellar hook assembly protein FlgD [Rickettsiales endosymbiont of Stachyamoeba lipophora]AZL16244.1 flagellar hook assembly protein FlgD [Rickettsiales endosymbiont of Stachyamoeba lipophora]